MGELNVINEKPLTLVELKESLEEIEKRDTELNFRSNRTKEYLNVFAKKDIKEVEELKKKIEELNIPRLKDRQIVKIIDLMPVDLTSLKAVLSGENITIKEEDLKRILDVL